MKELTDDEFDSFVKAHKKVIVDLWAAWCGPCRIASPIFEELSKDYKGKMEFAKLDIMANTETAPKFGVVSIPTFLVFNNGELVGEIHGAMPKADFKEKIDEFL